MHMNEEKKINFIFLWRQLDWGFFGRRNESLVWELATRDFVGKIYHIEVMNLKGLILMFLNAIKKNSKLIRYSYFLQIKKALFPFPIKITEKIFVTSFIVLPGEWFNFISKINKLFIQLQVKLFLRSLEKEKNRVIFAYPPFYHLSLIISLIKHNFLILEIIDDILYLMNEGYKKEMIRNSYKDVFGICDAAFSPSQIQCEKYAVFTKKGIKINYNGVDVNNNKIIKPKENIFKCEGKLQIKRVGYVGSINHTMDCDLLEYVLLKNPKVYFVLIGFADSERTKWINYLHENYNNFYFLGKRSYQEIPGYLSCFDVLISLKRDDMIRGGDSIKVYEYLATGKPIVSTSVEAVRKFKEIIYIAADKFEFNNLLKKALEEDDERLRKKRMQIAKQNSWKTRIDQMLKETKLLDIVSK